MVATCCGADVYYERTGSGKKRVVLLHGWGCSTELMRPVEQALSKDMEVLSGLRKERKAPGTLGRSGVCGLSAGTPGKGGLPSVLSDCPLLRSTRGHLSGLAGSLSV